MSIFLYRFSVEVDLLSKWIFVYSETNQHVKSKRFHYGSCALAKCDCKTMIFLHDRPWISPWIKSISNELDITCHVFASQLSGHCDVIANRLWRYQQNVKGARHGTGIMCEDPRFIVIYRFAMSCKKWNNVCTLVTNCFCTHPSIILVFISLVAAQLRR